MAVDVSEPWLMLGDAHRPEDAHALGVRDGVRDGFERLDRQAADARRLFHRERLEALAVRVEAVHPLIDERRVRQAVVQQVAGDGVQPDQVGSRLGMQKQIGAPGHLVLAEIGHDQLLAVEFVRALDARRDHRMALGRVAADDEHQVGLLDVRDRARIAAVADRAEQAHGRRRLAVARAVVDVVGADDRAGQLLHQVALFVRALRRGDESDGVRAARRLDRRQRRAISDSASSQLAGRNVSPSRISGVVRRSGLFTKSQPNFPFTHVEIPLAGPCSGATLRMWRSLVQTSKLHPTPQ